MSKHKRARCGGAAAACTLLAGIIALAAGAALADDSFPVNVYPCPRAERPPTLDGQLDDAVWQQAPVVSGFLAYGKDTLAEVQTSFRVLWDDRYLYLGIHCDEPVMGKLVPLNFARDEHAVFGNETIELFVDPDHTHGTYYQLAMNATASLYDGIGEDISWNSETVVKAFRGGDFWSLEVAVPWSSLRSTAKVGKVVGFNVCRDRNLGEKEWTNWARTLSGFHDPDRFAHLVLSGTPEQVGRLAGEFRKGGRTGPVVIFSAEGFSRTTYAQLAAGALADLDKLVSALEEEGRRDTDRAAADELGKRLDAYRQQVAELRTRAGSNLDAAQWVRLDVDSQKLIVQLRNVVWEARLSALLSAI